MKKQEQLDLEFQKSSYSGSYGCVGVSKHEDIIVVTNTKNKEAFVEFSPYEWKIFIKGVKNNEFDKFSK